MAGRRIPILPVASYERKYIFSFQNVNLKLFFKNYLDTLAAFVQGRNKYLVVLHPVVEAFEEPEIEEVLLT